MKRLETSQRTCTLAISSLKSHLTSYLQSLEKIVFALKILEIDKLRSQMKCHLPGTSTILSHTLGTNLLKMKI